MVAVGIERIERLKVSQPTPVASSFIQSSQTGTLSAGPSADTSVTYAPARRGVFLGPWDTCGELAPSGEKRAGPRKRTAGVQLSSSWGGQDHDRWHFSDACEGKGVC